MLAKLKPHADVAYLILRIVVGIIFLVHGNMKLQGLINGSPLPPIMKILAIAEPLGGLALIVGFLTQWAALGLAIIMFGAMYTKMAVYQGTFVGAKGAGWEFDLVICAACIVIFFEGAGKYALDAVLWKKKR